MLYTEWSRVRYIGSMSNKKQGEDAKILEYINTNPGHELYKIRYYVPGIGNQDLIVPEAELTTPEEFVYRWVSRLSESQRNYSVPGIAKAQANRNKGKRQRARVIWEDC